MADSPGALLPGVKPAEASNTVLKALFTVQGLAVVAGLGAWWIMSRKKTRKNPRRRSRS